LSRSRKLARCRHAAVKASLRRVLSLQLIAENRQREPVRGYDLARGEPPEHLGSVPFLGPGL
jgi:hypothetical protein